MPWRLGVLLAAIGTILFPVASVAQPTVPDVPKEIAVPPGHKLLFKVEGKGVQIYKAVEGKSGTPEWVLEAPLADLFECKGGKAGCHYDNPPSWEAADGSKVVKSGDAKSAPAPNPKEDIPWCQPTAHRFAFSDSASLRVGQTRADGASLRFVPVMMSSHRGAPASPLTLGGVESSVSHGRRPLRESLDIRTLPPSRRPRPSRERQTGVTGRFPVRRAEPTFLADEMSAPADFLVNDAVSEERTSGRSDALSVRTLAAGQDEGGGRQSRHFQPCGLHPTAPDRGRESSGRASQAHRDESRRGVQGRVLFLRQSGVSGAPNQALHLTAAAGSVFRVQRLTGPRGR